MRTFLVASVAFAVIGLASDLLTLGTGYYPARTAGATAMDAASMVGWLVWAAIVLTECNRDERFK